MVMANARREPQVLQPFIELQTKTFGRLRAVLGDVEENLPEVLLGFRVRTKDRSLIISGAWALGFLGSRTRASE